MMTYQYIIIFIFFLGLAFGSFLGMLTFRLGRNIPLSGRSFCPRCKKLIAWYDNIPLLSFIFLGGRCRRCHKPISPREPLIELGTAAGFVGIFLKNSSWFSQNSLPSVAQSYEEALGVLFLPILLSLFLILLAIFVVDLEKMLIPDHLLAVLGGITFIVLLTLPSPTLFTHLFVGAVSASLFLSLYLATRGRGMGFGDVKLSFLLGALLGYPGALVGFFVAFLTGGAIGLILILTRRARLGLPVPFGPFLIFGALTAFLFGDKILSWYLP